ncbi:hypothetical protein BDN70DRAFT_902449, partial [Pholiota conissans]
MGKHTTRNSQKRRRQSNNTHSHFVDLDPDEERPVAPILDTFRHDIVSGNSIGRPTVHTKYFTLAKSPKKTASGTFTLPEPQPLEWTPSPVDDAIDIVDYATSGNFEQADFDLNLSAINGSESYNQEFEPLKKRARSDRTWHPLREWEQHDRDRDVSEVLRLEGRGDYAHIAKCYDCTNSEAIYRCVDCEAVEMFCSS